MSRKTGLQVANTLSDFANTAIGNEKLSFVEAVTTDHKTLQEDTFMMFLKCIEKWSEMKVQGDYDARNEYTCKASKVMIKALKDEGLL